MGQSQSVQERERACELQGGLRGPMVSRGQWVTGGIEAVRGEKVGEEREE